ncbi:MAG TPA: hypothetical protein VFT74_18885 [Isosphaeraceae bacterium]|nr:hypothetical protein [Isosphaeraceae bacterium]
MRRNAWRRLMESTEGPNVTIQIPREWAEELMRALMTSLEIEDMDGEPDMEDDPHAEPDEDDLGGIVPDMDGDDDDDGPPGFASGDDDDEPDFAAGDDDEEDDDSDDDDDDDEDDDDEKDEAADYSRSGGNPSGLRPQTALGESAFARAKMLTERHIRSRRAKVARRGK